LTKKKTQKREKEQKKRTKFERRGREAEEKRRGSQQMNNMEDAEREPHPLWRAARNGNLLMAEEIIKNLGGGGREGKEETRVATENESVLGEGGQHPIHAAIESANPPMIDLLFDSGLVAIDVNIRDSAGRSPLFYAALMGNLEVVQRLLTFPGCEVDAETYSGWRPIHAALGGINAGLIGAHEEVASLLLDLGANPQKPTTNGCTPLHYACCIGLESVVRKLLLQHAVDVNAIALNSRFPSRSLPTMEAPKNGNLQTPLHMALEGSHERVSQLLIDEHLDASCVDTPDSDGRTALWLAARAGFDSIVESLVHKGADVNAQMIRGKTPLMASIGAPRQTPGHKRVVDILLEKGAFLNTENDNQMTALSLAVKHGYTDTCAKIFAIAAKTGTKFLTKEQLGILLHSAIRYRHFSVTELLLQHGADVEICDKDGRTPLHKAVMCANTEVVRRLVRCGVPLDKKDDCGRTPLDIAVFGLNNSDLQKLTKPWVRPWAIIVVLVQAGALLTRTHQALFNSILDSRRDLDELEPENPRIQLTDSDFAEEKKNREIEEIFCWCLEFCDSCRPLKVLARNSVRRTLGRRLGALRGQDDLGLPEFIYNYLILDRDDIIFSLD